MSGPLTRRIDINADLGEGCPWDTLLLERVTSASVSCGAHAGAPEQIRATLRTARQRGVIVGAHPGYPDRAHFGREERTIGSDVVRHLIVEQVASLEGWATPLGIRPRFLKPHGALYNQAQREPDIAAGVVSAAAELGLPVLGMPGSCVEIAARNTGVRFVAEGFADRRYTADGRLVPRTEPGALLDDPAEITAQVLELARRGMATLCIHGDSPGAVALAELVIAAARAAGIAIAPFLRRERPGDLADGFTTRLEP
jgi:UPF0271 protein